jgi:hypothetical protein
VVIVVAVIVAVVVLVVVVVKVVLEVVVVVVVVVAAEILLLLVVVVVVVALAVIVVAEILVVVVVALVVVVIVAEVIVVAVVEVVAVNPWFRPFLEQLTVPHLAKKFPTFHCTRRFFACSHQLSISPIPSHITTIYTYKQFKSHLRISVSLIPFSRIFLLQNDRNSSHTVFWNMPAR